MSRQPRRSAHDRRWRLPPIPAHASHSFAGASLLEELSGTLGFALWQSFRDVQLWTSTPERERARLFAPGAAESRATPAAREIRAPLGVLLDMVKDPTGAREEAVGGACAEISRWAEERGAISSALAFAEAAAGAAAQDAALAYAAGRLARRRGEYARAESWFLRAAGLGRRSGDWESYAIAWVGMGKLQILRGSLPRARRVLLRALRVARRNRLREVEGMALHNLVVVATESDDLAAAEAWAGEAFRTYGPGHAEVVRIAHDLAHIWNLQGLFVRAQAVFQALLPHFTDPADRLFVLSNLVRSAGGAGDGAVFRDAWAEAWTLAESPHAQDGVSRAMLDLARGAASAGENELAGAAAGRAATLSAGRDEAKVRAEAESLLESLATAGATPEVHDGTASDDGAGDRLAAEIIASLNARAGV